MTLKREIKDAYIEGGASIYVKTHGDAVYVDENETETLTDRLDNIKGKIDNNTSQLNAITNEKANIYNDGLIFGIEYLTYYLDKVRKSESANIVISGDSQFCGVSLTNENYKIENLINNYFKSKGIFNITIINDAVSGARSSAWVSTYLAQDLAKNPDLYILKWGANDAC